jgi:hypothetical protein
VLKYLFIASIFIIVLLGLPIRLTAQTELFTFYTHQNYPVTIKFPIDWTVDDSQIYTNGVLFTGKARNT